MTNRPTDTLRANIATALDSRDHETAVRTALDAVHSGEIAIPDLYCEVLSPLLADIGSSWAHGTERVWQEHLASHAVRTIVESLYLDVRDQAAAVPRRGVTVLLACPPQEQHELGLRMLADRFDLGGYDVVLLGADTPVSEIVAAATATGASIVALSISTSYERVAFRTFIEQIRAGLPGVHIAVGGPAFRHDEQTPGDEFLDITELGLPGTRKAGE